jgi:hypothetical protein
VAIRRPDHGLVAGGGTVSKHREFYSSVVLLDVLGKEIASTAPGERRARH